MSARIIVGDVRDVLATLDAGSVQTCVTSPPYYALRDYGTASWDGGDAACDHAPARQERASRERSGLTGGMEYVNAQEPVYRAVCGKCGATRVDRQIGLEPTIAEYIATMVDVFREVKRVLRDDGTLWLNIGDSFAGSGKGRNADGTHQEGGKQGTNTGTIVGLLSKTVAGDGLKPKDLCMIPARLALALQDDGWWVRSEITWCKRAPMPESVTDRPTTATEKIYLLTKSDRYFYDATAVREPGSVNQPFGALSRLKDIDGSGDGRGGRFDTYREPTAGRNMWNYWLLGPEPFAQAHFAVFPTEIPRRCILAGTSERGACPACGAPWKRTLERVGEIQRRWSGNDTPAHGDNWRGDNGRTTQYVTNTTGWQPTCQCAAGDAVPCVVLDPFSGAGTTGVMALRHGRDYIGIELNSDYAAMSERRIRGDCPLLNRVEVEAA